MNKLISILLVGTFYACHQSNYKSNQDLNQSTGPLQESLTSELTELHRPGYINGFGAAIVNQNGILYANGIGYANTQTITEYTENTIQNIGSVSKTFIGIALLKAEELGELNLDDPIIDYLPFEVKNPSFPDMPITIRQLTTHTSTILDTDYYDEKSYVLKDDVPVSDSLMAISESFNSPDSKMHLIDFLEKILSEKGEWYEEAGFSKNRPGDIYEYSNVGATLAAAV